MDLVFLMSALGSLLVLVYTYVAYPLLIGAAARLRPHRLRSDPAHLPSVSVLIPVYDGQDYMEAKLESLLRQDYPPDRVEILVCSDGSTDDTDAVVERFARRDGRIRLLRLEARSGKPSALNRMLAEATGDAILLTDVRQPLAPAAMRALAAWLADPRVGCASGNLVLRGSTGAGAYWTYENAIRRWEARFRGTVGVTGPIYMVRRTDVGPIPSDIILDDLWIPGLLQLQGRVNVLSEEAEAFDDAFADEREMGRKLRTLAGNFQLFVRLPKLLLPGCNPLWLETISHKLLRLLCPWALLLLLFSTAAMAHANLTRGAASSPTVLALLGGQLGLYVAAGFGRRVGKPGALARSFVLFNVAAVRGLIRYLRGAQGVRW
jgi:biofilm PGA synthesis N-glycosyltransferase PgaC